MRCKNCKEVFTPSKFNQKFCFKSDCVKVWVQSEKDKEWRKRKTKMKNDLKATQDYIKIAQQIVNKYIRERDKGNNCISCQKPINGVRHASHFLSAGGHSAIRFHEDNIFVSCYKCNVMLSGNQIAYRKVLIQKIGVERVEWLEENGSIAKKWSLEEIKEITTKYKEMLKKM